MRNIFFVDSENVGDSWIQLFDYLNDDDCILVFYTDKSPNMSYTNVVALKQSPLSLSLRNQLQNRFPSHLCLLP